MARQNQFPVSHYRARTNARTIAAAVACCCEALERRVLLSAEYGIVRGFVHDDINGNGQIDPNDPAIPGFVIFADLNKNGVFDFDEPGSESAQSGQDILPYELQLPVGPVVLRLRPLGETDWDFLSPAGGSIEVDVVAERPTTVDWLVRRKLDWGDAPDGPLFPGSNYATLAANNGARHFVTTGYSLGARIDAEADGQPHAQALGDDLAGIDDEDGVTFITPLIAGSVAQIRVDFTSTMGLTGVLDAWFDWNANGHWGDAGEKAISGFVLAPGPNIINVAVPSSAVAGLTFARFRLSPNGVQRFDGTGYDGTIPLRGEVEDYLIRIEPGQQLDWGDAPDGPQFPGFNYRTLAANNGARHAILQNFTLGRVIDAEPDGQPSINANADDLNGVPDDEDGVTFLTPLVPGQAAQVQVELHPAAAGGFFSAWIDFNGNGTWADAGEQVFNGQPLAPGMNVFNIMVPATAKAGQTYARFRLGQTPSAITTFFGFGGFGEVEDYLIRIDPPPGQTGELDWGDAPDIPGTILQYPTLAMNNGARHSLLQGYMLGTRIDAEPDGQPTILADGDDNNGIDDEDGVTFLDPFIPGNVVRIEVFLTNTAGASARLDAWIDWERDGNWFQPGNQIANAVPLNPGPNILFVNVPANAQPGRTFARFRLSREGGLPFFGFGDIGEVEDYVLKIEDKSNRRFDWGDAPEFDAAGNATAYPTTAANNGAHHVIKAGFQLGWRIDAEPDGQPTLNADGDDLSNLPDEDGVIFLTPLVPGGIAQVQVIAPAGGVLDAWIDWHANLNWSDAVDRIATTFPLVPGVNILNVPVPADAKLGPTYARFRLSPNGVASYDGFGFEGEVEDYRIRITPGGGEQRFDWGDAPKSYGTLAADNGAHHRILQGFNLGQLIDAEPDGQPSIGANRDDLNGVDDEDGVTLVGGVLIAGSNAQFQVFLTNTIGSAARLDAWIDFNLNGVFDAAEHVLVAVPLNPGLNVLNVPIPANAAPGDTYARFRLTRNGIASPLGFGLDGEVEDYLFRLRREKPEEGPFDWGDAPDGFGFLNYPTLAANNGAHHSHLPGLTLGHRWDAEPDGQPSLDAMRDDLVGIDDEDGVQFLTPFIPGQVAKIMVFAPGGGVLDAWIDWDIDGNWTGANDRIFDHFPLAAGANLLEVQVPVGLKEDPYRTFARFRLSREGVASFDGFGGDGEVEDYRIIINGPSASFNPTTGTVFVSGTAGDDHILLNFNPRTEMLEIFFADPPDPEMPDFQLNFGEIRGLNFSLGAGDDVVELNGGDVDARDYILWQRGGFSFDGGEGFDKLLLNFSKTEASLNVVGSFEGFRILDVSDPGAHAHFAFKGFGFVEFEGGMGDDMLLLPAVQKVTPSPAPMSLNFLGGPGDDHLMVYPTEQLSLNFEEIKFDGGAQSAGGPGDMLSVYGPRSAGPGAGPHFEYTPTPGMPDAGNISIFGFNPQPEPPAMLINFTGLEPVNIASGDVTLTLPPGSTGNDVISIDLVSLDIGDSNVISGTSSGFGFEHLIVTDIGTFMLDVASNDLGGVGGSSDTVHFNGRFLSAQDLRMEPGQANLTLNINAGPIPINWDPGALGAPVTVNVNNGGEVHFGTTQHLAALNINPGGTAILRPGRHTVVTRNLMLLSPGPLPPGRFDITDGNVIVHDSANTPFMMVWDWIVQGRAGGSWTGQGISSSTAAGDSQLAVGVGDNATMGKTSFAGHPVGPSSILITLTLGGDANLDWQVTIADLGILAANWQQSPRFWQHGNFNYDLAVTIADLGILAANWQKNLGAPPPPFSSVSITLEEDQDEEEDEDDLVDPLSADSGKSRGRSAAAKAAVPPGHSKNR